MNKVWIVAWREFLETVKTRAFIFGVIIMPMLMIGLIFSTEKIIKASASDTQALRTLAVVDRTGVLQAPLEAAQEAYNLANANKPLKFEFVSSMDMSANEIAPASSQPTETQPTDPVEALLTERLTQGEIFAYLMIPQSVLDPRSNEPIRVGRKGSQIQVSRELRRLLTRAVVTTRYARHDPPLDPGLIDRLGKRVDLLEIDPRTGEQSTGNTMLRVMTPFAFLFLLYMGTFGISQGLLTSVIEEKSSRVIEVLLSAVSPLQLMAGKILGMVMVGLMLMAVWIAVGYSGARANNVLDLVTSERIGYLLLYFLPAYLLFAGMLAGIGAAFNTLKEAQGMVTPVVLSGVLPMLFWFPVSEYPQSTLAITLSFIPPLTPFIMILRVCADPDTPLWQIALSLVLLWATVAFVIWMAAKIFRVGILMYGKPPTPKELLTWLRYS